MLLRLWASSCEPFLRGEVVMMRRGEGRDMGIAPRVHES